MSAGEHPDWGQRLRVSNETANALLSSCGPMHFNPPDRIDAIKAERQKVYGDPRENHKGIAQMWACLLQPHAEAIAKMEPLPEHTVAMMMAALKLNRMRRVFHQDNYDDLTAYISFAREWQKDHDSKTN